MSNEIALTLKIESYYDCPRFEKQKVSHWQLGNGFGWRYDCNKANRQIAPSDGVNPPPSWCPLRKQAANSNHPATDKEEAIR